MGLLIRRGAVLAVLLALLAAGCGGRRGETEAGRAEPPVRTDEEREPARTEPPEPRVIDRDASHADDPGAGTAARRASSGLVEEGKGYLIAGRPAEAVRRFERAARVDPSNGFAWYWLGKARIEVRDPGGAIGVLEKAATLLGPYPEWRDRVDELLSSLRRR